MLHVAANAEASGIGGSLRVDIVPMFEDNFAYIVTDEVAMLSAFVDPADPDAVMRAWRKLEASEEVGELSAIFTTHHHDDHAGGNIRLAAMFPGLHVYGPAGEVIPGRTLPVEGGSEFTLGTLNVSVISTGGHTRGGVSYVVEGSGPAKFPPAVTAGDQGETGASAALFSGDTLFVGGCGRLFEGDAAQLRASLQRLAQLDPATRVFCGHEYTQRNLAFAALMDPTNGALERKMEAVEAARREGLASVPSTIGDELATNPFLRCGDVAVAQTVQAIASASLLEQVDAFDPDDVFRAMRLLKDKM